MSARLTRKEIKHDEFASVVGRSVEYAESHSRGLLVAVGAVALAVVLGIGIYLFLDHRSLVANDALAYAVKVYTAPIQASGAKPHDPKEPSFASEAARRARAEELLTRMRKDHPFSSASDVASIYLAEIYAGENKLDQARQLWSDFVRKHRDHILAGQARLNLFDLDRSKGKAQQVIQELRTMLEQPDAPLPQDVLLYELATTLEQLNRDQEALQTYQRILDEFPQSPYHQTAQQKVAANRGGPMPFPGVSALPGS
ncbi:MAG TPA: tetratricopeptide repeat protein [Thermoanaerobaculia bacterium]|nr:tetratricopeptide repeat protein [Thermoanaerobaculia bacterium]